MVHSCAPFSAFLFPPILLLAYSIKLDLDSFFKYVINVCQILNIYLLCLLFQSGETVLQTDSAKAYFNISMRLRSRCSEPDDCPKEHTAMFRICWPARLFRCFKRAR